MTLAHSAMAFEAFQYYPAVSSHAFTARPRKDVWCWHTLFQLRKFEINFPSRERHRRLKKAADNCTVSCSILELGNFNSVDNWKTSNYYIWEIQHPDPLFYSFGGWCPSRSNLGIPRLGNRLLWYNNNSKSSSLWILKDIPLKNKKVGLGSGWR